MLRTIMIIALFMLSLKASADGTMLMQAEHLLEQALIKESNYKRCCAGQALMAAIDIAAAPLLLFSLLDLGCQNRIGKANDNRIEVEKMDLTIKSLKKLIKFLSDIESAYVENSETTKDQNYSINRYSKSFKKDLFAMKRKNELENATIERIYKINLRGDDRLQNLETATDYYGLVFSKFSKRTMKKKAKK